MYLFDVFMCGMHVCVHVCVCGSIAGECTCVYTHVSTFSAQVHSSILDCFPPYVLFSVSH